MCYKHFLWRHCHKLVVLVIKENNYFKFLLHFNAIHLLIFCFSFTYKILQFFVHWLAGPWWWSLGGLPNRPSKYDRPKLLNLHNWKYILHAGGSIVFVIPVYRILGSPITESLDIWFLEILRYCNTVILEYCKLFNVYCIHNIFYKVSYIDISC